MANREYKPYPKHERVRSTHPEPSKSRFLYTTLFVRARLPSTLSRLSVMDQMIKPGVGLGEILLGSREASIRAMLGTPTSIRNVEHADGDSSRDWEYDSLMLSLVFSASDDYRLGTITTSSISSVFAGENVVGMPESRLLQCDFDGIGPPMLEDDFEECGKDYCWQSLNLSCWVLDGVVTSATIIPLFDPSGNIPQWPNGTA